jgi:glutathione S-transferase
MSGFQSDNRFLVVIGNKAYSSWSLRGWLACRIACGPDGFEEFKLPLAGKTATDEEKERIRLTLLHHSPTGKVPALRDSVLGVVVHDSLAICLHVAETYPNSKLLPVHGEGAARAMCLAVSAEMHAGFEALRTHCPMNCVVSAVARGAETLQRDDVKRDVIRLGEMWTDMRERFGIPYQTSTDPTGAYLFGHITIADCMYAPVALRFKTYDPQLTSLEGYPLAQAYVRTLWEQEGVARWVRDAFEEGAEWKLGHYDAVADTATNTA